MIRLRLDVGGVEMVLAFVCQRPELLQLDQWQYGVELEQDGKEYDVNTIHDRQGEGCILPLGVVARMVINETKTTPKYIYFNLENVNDN